MVSQRLPPPCRRHQDEAKRARSVDVLITRSFLRFRQKNHLKGLLRRRRRRRALRSGEQEHAAGGIVQLIVVARLRLFDRADEPAGTGTADDAEQARIARSRRGKTLRTLGQTHTVGIDDEEAI